MGMHINRLYRFRRRAMGRIMEMEILLPASVDLSRLWALIPDKVNAHLSGKGTEYVLTYQGDSEQCIYLLEIIFKLESYKVHIKTT